MNEDALEVLPQDVVLNRVVPREMIQDLLAVARLDSQTVGRIAERLRGLQGFAEGQRLEFEIRSCLPQPADEVVASISRTLLNVRPTAVDRVIRDIRLWREVADDRKAYVPDGLFASLERNLRALVADYPAVALLRKANRLLREVGNEYQSAAIFVDLRPVFDESRERIEGFVPLANLRLLYVGQAGDRQACEVALTEDELRELSRHAEQAIAKLSVLKRTVETLSPNMSV